ncbi:MAG: rRNA pseudouridine synthase [Planctomycetes bacterium]|nr:rRNA pseudouridine synthase [Planctomycetota bacterium]
MTARRPAPGERLHKYIANCGYCSRRRAELLIARGLVTVNGAVVTEPGSKVIPGRDTVLIHGERIARKEPLTIMLNKPAGTITSTHDTHERLTVMDMLPKHVLECGVLPAGRLDMDTEGLLVLTNDGELLHRITHPSFRCEKEYRVHLDRAPSRNERTRLEEGIYLPQLGKRTQPARVDRIRHNTDGTTTLHIHIGEGMKRQVRRMFEILGMKVIHLERVAIGKLRLGDLERGKWRKLTGAEIELLVEGTETPKRPPRRRDAANRARAPSREDRARSNKGHR